MFQSKSYIFNIKDCAVGAGDAGCIS